jgi:hypothetical protein
MKGIALLLAVVGATACGASQHAATTPSGSSNEESPGATNAQGSDNPNRQLTKDECDELGAWISQVCHSNHSRQARIESWCSDVVSRTAAGSWTDECTKSHKYMDFMCFRSSDNPSAMMTCDRTVDH